MYGLWWILGILALTFAAFVWLDRLMTAQRRRRADLFAARNLMVLGGLCALLAAAGGVARAVGVPAATLVELQYYFSNRFRWEVAASLRALLGYAGAQPGRLLLSGAVFAGLGALLERLHPTVQRAAIDGRRRAVCWIAAALCAVLLGNPLGRALLGLDNAAGYIVSQGFFLLANPADMWLFHALAIYLCCLVIPLCGLGYALRAWPQMDAGWKRLLLAVGTAAGCAALIVCLAPLAGVALYPLSISFVLALVCGCFDPPAAKRRRRAARYSARENEIIDLLSRDPAWIDQVEPDEARSLYEKMRENGDCTLIPSIFSALRSRFDR